MRRHRRRPGDGSVATSGLNPRNARRIQDGHANSSRDSVVQKRQSGSGTTSPSVAYAVRLGSLAGHQGHDSERSKAVPAGCV